MGKTKKSRRRDFRTNLVPTRGPNSVVTNYSSSQHGTMIADMTSLDERKRVKACELLATVYSTNSRNLANLQRLTTPEVLSKVSMRLMDSSKSVQYEAVGAVRNIALTIFPEIVTKFIDCGILNIVLTLIKDHLPLTSEDSRKLTVQLLGCLTNFVAASETSVQLLSSQSSVLLPTILQGLAVTQPADIQLATANLLFTATDNFASLCDQIVSMGGFDSLAGRCLASIAPPAIDPTATAVAVAEADCAYFSFLLATVKCVGTVLNVVFSGSPALTAALMDRFSLVSIVQPVLATLNIDSKILDTIASSLVQDAIAREGAVGGADMQVEEVTDEMLEQQQEGDEYIYRGNAQKPTLASDKARTASLLAFEILQVAAEVITNISYHVSDHSEDEEEEEHGGGRGAGAGAAARRATEAHTSLLRAHPNSKQVHTLFSDPSVLSVISMLLFKFIDIVNSFCSPTAQLPVTIPVILECVDRFASACANVTSFLEDSRFAAQAQVSTSDRPESLFKSLLTVYTRSLERLLTFSDIATAATATAPAASAVEPGFESSDASASASASASADDDAQTFSRLVSSTDTETVDRGAMFDMLHQALVSSATCILATCRQASFQAMQAKVLDVQDAMLLQVTALALCKASTHASAELATACLDSIAALGVKDGEAEAVTKVPRSIISTRLNALVSNAVMRRLDQSLAQANELLSQSPLTMKKDALGDTLLVLESSFMAVIDLHSSDDAELFSNFGRLNVLSRISTGAPIANRLLALVQRQSHLRTALEPEQVARVEETLENITQFIEYKRSFR